jgi:DNA-binding PadR family transcriptional regulator
MGRKRRSNPLALAVMVLLFERPMHPYEMATTLKQRHKQESIKIRFGSLYTVIDRLVADGLIAPRQTIRQGRRPEKTVYELTPAGQAEMRGWLRALISEPAKEYTLFEAGLCLLAALPPGEAIDLLRQRQAKLEADHRELRAALDGILATGLPPLYLVEVEYRLCCMEAERRFVVALLRRIEDEGWTTSAAWNALHGVRQRPGRSREPRTTRGRRRPIEE